MAKTITLSKATGTVTVTANFTANDTVIIGNVTYKFVATPAAINDIDIGADAETSLDNLTLAINGQGTAGATTYFAGTKTVPGVVASNTATVLTLTARLGGTWANGIELREGTDGGGTFSVTRTMQGGAGALHDLIEEIHDLNQPNSEIAALIYHVQNAANGA